MGFIFVVVVIMLIEKSCSQILSKFPDCFSNKDTITLSCDTTWINESIYFNLNTVSKGGCVPSFGCGENITQSGTTTIMTIYSYNDPAHGGSWTCTFGLLTSPVVVIAENPCDSPCDGNLISYLLFAVLCLLAPLVKIVIILYLWYKCRNSKRIPEDKYIRIIVTAQKQIKFAAQLINNEEEQDISLCNSCHEIIILVRAGVKIQCSFQVDGNAFTLSFEITEDLLHARHGQMIKLPTKFEVHPEYETIQWSFNKKELDCKKQYYVTEVSPATYGVYDIEMKFSKQVMICIQNMRVQGDSTCDGCYWKLMKCFVVIDLVLAVIWGIITGLSRLNDGFCVEVIAIILAVVITWILFTSVEVALIYFMLIKRTESKESSGSQDSDMVKITTSEKRTGSPNAETTKFSTRTGSPKLETTTFTTDGLSSSDVTATTQEGQNSRNWQPPNNNMAVNSDVHQ